MATIRMSISMEIPEGASREDCLRYTVDAVQSWKGSLRPPGGYAPDDEGDPMFELDYRTVRGSYATTRGNKRRVVRLDGEE